MLNLLLIPFISLSGGAMIAGKNDGKGFCPLEISQETGQA